MKKEFRIKKSSEIESLIKLKNVQSEGGFVLYTKNNHDENHFRYALSVPKKFGDAVKRNEIKRRSRAIIRSLKIKCGFDFFLVVKESANKLDFKTIEEKLKDLFKKANLLEDFNEQN